MAVGGVQVLLDIRDCMSCALLQSLNYADCLVSRRKSHLESRTCAWKLAAAAAEDANGQNERRHY
eukprot:3653267-Pleurochrysis_carterae.AAC.5